MMEEKEFPNERAKPRKLYQITEPALCELKTESELTYKYLVTLIRDGSFERHQTKGEINRMVDELLKKVLGDNINHEN